VVGRLSTYPTRESVTLTGFLDLSFIEPFESKYVNKLSGNERFGTYPIGLLGDIEIMFLHYHTADEAKEKWERRCGRINWEKIIYKFNDQNGCTPTNVIEFFSLPIDHKLFFTIHKEWPKINDDGYYVIKQKANTNELTASHEPFGSNRYFDLTKMINML